MARVRLMWLCRVIWEWVRILWLQDKTSAKMWNGHIWLHFKYSRFKCAARAEYTATGRVLISFSFFGSHGDIRFRSIKIWPNFQNVLRVWDSLGRKTFHEQFHLRQFIIKTTVNLYTRNAIASDMSRTKYVCESYDTWKDIENREVTYAAAVVRK